jgi:hypothetical protein
LALAREAAVIFEILIEEKALRVTVEGEEAAQVEATTFFCVRLSSM